MSDINRMRAEALAQVAADHLVRGLPMPKAIQFMDQGYPSPRIQFRMDDDDSDAVHEWADYLNLGKPFGHRVECEPRSFLDYGTEGEWQPPQQWVRLGWRGVRVWSAIFETEEP